MTAFPLQIDAQDVPHLGMLFRRIREARGLSQSDVARALGVACSTISKLEGTGRSRRNQIVERYVQMLRFLPRENNLIPFPLSDEAADILLLLGREAHGDHHQALTARISAYDFGLIASPNCPPELKTLLRRLRFIRWPAFICDGLWFVHAVNGTMLNFLGIDAESTVLYQWESWHIIGAQLVEPSSAQPVHTYSDNTMPPAIWAFFQMSAHYLFTPQMRALLHELHHLSSQNGQHFGEWWYLATALTLYFESKPSMRVVHRGDNAYCIALMELEPCFVSQGDKARLPYFLGIMQPIGEETQAKLEQLVGPARPGDLFFAAQYDSAHSFHVNSWPEVAHEVLG